jgi:hypothetical protein
MFSHFKLLILYYKYYQKEAKYKLSDIEVEIIFA